MKTLAIMFIPYRSSCQSAGLLVTGRLDDRQGRSQNIGHY